VRGRLLDELVVVLAIQQLVEVLVRCRQRFGDVSRVVVHHAHHLASCPDDGWYVDHVEFDVTDTMTLVFASDRAGWRTIGLHDGAVDVDHVDLQVAQIAWQLGQPFVHHHDYRPLEQSAEADVLGAEEPGDAQMSLLRGFVELDIAGLGGEAGEYQMIVHATSLLIRA
jgi:hypothetical protein